VAARSLRLVSVIVLVAAAGPGVSINPKDRPPPVRSPIATTSVLSAREGMVRPLPALVERRGSPKGMAVLMMAALT
jgi:hypothetical protein